MIEHSDVFVMEDIRPVEVVGFDMRTIPNDTRDWPGTEGLEPVLGDLYNLTVASTFAILVLLVFLLEDC